MQNVPATTNTTRATESPSRIDHTASKTTIHGITGRYGFHGWVNTFEP